MHLLCIYHAYLTLTIEIYCWNQLAQKGGKPQMSFKITSYFGSAFHKDNQTILNTVTLQK